MEIESTQHDKGARSYSARDFLTVVFRRRRLIFFFFFGVTTVAAGAAMFRDPTYESSANLLVKKGRAEVPVAVKEAPALVVDRVTEQDLNSEVEILRSRWLIEETVHVLEAENYDIESLVRSRGPIDRLREAVAVRIGTTMSAHDKLVLHLSESVKAESIGKSSLIQVTYRSKDADWTARLVNAIVETYIDRRAQVFQSGQTESFFEEQMRSAKNRLDEAEQTLEGHLEAYGITTVAGPLGVGPLSAQKSLVLDRLAELENQFAEAEGGVREHERRVSALKKRLKEEVERLPSANSLFQDSSISELEKALVVLRLRRDELQQDFTSSGRLIRDLDDQIAKAEVRLTDAEQRAGGINRTEANPVHVSLRTELLLAQTGLEGLRSRYASSGDLLTAERSRLAALNQNGFEIERLALDVTTAREAYLLYQKKHEEARISSAMDREKIVNVSVAQPALRALKPSGASRSVTLFLAMVFGVLGGLAAAFLRDFFDHTFVTGEDVERRLGLTHLGSIPDTRNQRMTPAAGR